jgi:hypothetical protein
MRVLRTNFSWCAVVVLTGLSAEASVTTQTNVIVPTPRKIAAPAPLDDARMMQESLSRDVARHPDDFIVFATEGGAEQFFATHRDDVERETDSRIILRGVVGYWRGKTLVVLPWGLSKNF